MHTIYLQSSDKVDFLVPVVVTEESKTIATMLEDLGIENDEEEEIKETFLLPNIRSVVLRKVLDWCEHTLPELKPESEVYIRDEKIGEPKRRRIRKYIQWE